MPVRTKGSCSSPSTLFWQIVLGVLPLSFLSHLETILFPASLSVNYVSHCRYLKNLTSTRVTGNLARAIVPLRSLQRFQSPLLLFAVVIVAFSGELEMLG